MVEFIKMHGSGNDFVFINSNNLDEILSTTNIKNISNRNFGIGCDQVVIYSLNEDNYDAKILIYNFDGSDGGVCGNAAICMAYLLAKSSIKSKYSIKISNKIWYATITDTQTDNFSINVGRPTFDWQEIPLSKDCNTLDLPISVKGALNIVAVGMGNPHCVIVAEKNNIDDILNQASSLENHSLFSNRANIEIVKIISKNEIELQVWERGVGFTLACGSGACAAVCAVIKLGLCNNNVKVNLPGGKLKIQWASEIDSVILTGPAKEVFNGKILIKN